jgi:hypothetical protein
MIVGDGRLLTWKAKINGIVHVITYSSEDT